MKFSIVVSKGGFSPSDEGRHYSRIGSSLKHSDSALVPQFGLLGGSQFLDYVRWVLAGGIRSLQGAIPGPIPRPSLALVAREFLQPAPSSIVPTDRNTSAESGSESEVGGVAEVFAVSSARDGRGIRPGMAESNGKDSGHSLDPTLNLRLIQTEAPQAASSD